MIAVMIAGATAGVLSLIVTRFLITAFRTRGLGQPILGKEDRGPEHHMAKQGTPTMGGIAIVLAAFIGWLVAHVRRGLPFSDQAIIVWVGVLVMAFMGFLDDFIKVRKRHNRGIFWKQKNYVTMLLSFGIAYWLVEATGISTTISLTRADYPGWELPTWAWVIWAGLIIWATTNAVNVTDGLDGLAGGSALMGFGAFTIIGYWAFRNPEFYGAVVNPLDLAALAAAFGGACLGFLWFNAAPARIIMGDVGALGLGSALALLALTMNTQLLLLLICGLNVMEAGSVALQMGVFKASGRTRRLFRMSPIHHHFELLGWPETTVIIRFWLISAVCVAAALGLFIGDFTRICVGSPAVILVLGLAVAGAATVRALRQRGYDVVAADDGVDDAKRALAAELDVELVASPDLRRLADLVAATDVVVPAPGVPETHQVFALAHGLGRPVVSELELAYGWEQERPGGPRPMLAVTGTDGKTTTTLWAVDMLAAGGVRAVAAGNTDVPLVEALDLDVDAFVVECTSFRLAWTRAFRGEAAVWLNLAPDHLNWHVTMETYMAAKAHIFTQQRPDDVAIGFAADPIVMAQLAAAPARHVTFGTDRGDYHVSGAGADARLVGPHGELGAVASLGRALPHDLTNGLAAAALVLETGLVGPEAVAAGLASFVGPPHRIELVGDADGVRWYNDSKATTPHAASVAIRAFDHVVLIAGGLNKGLDLTPMTTEPDRLQTVVAIGEAADLIASTFAVAAPVVRAGSMAEAVEQAAAAARPGDVVLLSPGCASFDWYPDGGYPAHGDDFRRLVQRRIGPPPAPPAQATTGAA